MLERHEIEAFLAVAEELHFGHAAERLTLSPARVSQTIRKLERRIGAPLFERTSRRVTLTPLGQRLREDIAGPQAAINAAFTRAVASARGAGGVLRIGVMGSYGQIMMPVFDAFATRHPDCEVQLQEIHFSDPFGALRSGQVDIAVPWLPVAEPDFTVGPAVGSEPIALAVPARHPFAGRASVSLEELVGETLVNLPRTPNCPDYWIDAHAPGRAPSGAVIAQDGPSVVTFHALLATVAAGKAISYVSGHGAAFYPTPNVAYVPITEAPRVTWALVWRTSGENHRIRAFAEVAADVQVG